MGLKRSRGEYASQPERRSTKRDFDSLVNDLHTGNTDVRRLAARDLMDEPKARQPLLDRLGEEQEPIVVEAIFNALSSHCDDELVRELMHKLKSEDAQVRNGAIEVLQNQPGLFANHVNELLCDEDPDVRIFAVDVIGAISHADAAQWLHAVVLKDKHINVVGTAVDKLAEVGDSTTLPVLTQVEQRFPHEAYIQFAITCVRHAIQGEGV